MGTVSYQKEYNNVCFLLRRFMYFFGWRIHYDSTDFTYLMITVIWTYHYKVPSLIQTVYDAVSFFIFFFFLSFGWLGAKYQKARAKCATFCLWHSRRLPTFDKIKSSTNVEFSAHQVRLRMMPWHLDQWFCIFILFCPFSKIVLLFCLVFLMSHLFCSHPNWSWT